MAEEPFGCTGARQNSLSTKHKRQQLQLNCSCIPWWNWVIQSPCWLNMISRAAPEKQRHPPVVANLLSLSLASLSLLFQRIFGHFLFLSYHSRHLLEPPPTRLSPAWAFGLIWNPWDKGLFQPCQSSHNASLSTRAPSVCQPHTHTRRSTIRRVSLSPIHGAIYTPAPFI